MKRNLFLLVLVALMSNVLNGQTSFNRGVNMSGWFQTSNTKQIQFTKFTKKDFENIKGLGCDVIRLPINLFYMTNGKPDYTINPLFFSFLDQAADWAEELQINLIIDNHSTDDIASKNADLQNVLTKVWVQMAEHYKDRSKFILYEIMNEPNGITTQNWGKIQQAAIDAIRAIDSTHTLIVGASSYNTYNELNSLPVYSDKNLIYTFHFYDPMVFTHQGANWPVPSLATLTGIPFPYQADSMPVLPGSFKGTWIESSFNNYKNDGTIAKLKSTLDIAVNFKNTRNVSVYCGEFGVYMPFAKDTNRNYWYSEIRKYLEANGIAWTTWDYKGAFGLFENNSSEMFDYDVNTSLVSVLGLNVPQQDTFHIVADTVGFSIYSDYIGEKIFEASYGTNSIVDYYSENKPNNGNYSLYWTGPNQYGAVGLNFVPDKDMSKLVEGNYALSFLVRGNSPGTKIEMRFIDTKTSDPADHPWRMNYTIDENVAKWDGKWHKVYIPLKTFVDQGSYDVNAWYNPAGAFDWSAIDRFDITNDQGSLKGKEFWFDNFTVTNLDTAQVYDTTALPLPVSVSVVSISNLSVFPNPANEKVTIRYSVANSGNTAVSIFNLSGQKIKEYTGTNMITWDLSNANGEKVPDGIYICRITSEGATINTKISVLRK